MTKVNSDEIGRIYRRLSVQSILDLKENFGCVDIETLSHMNNECTHSFLFHALDVLCGVCFVYDTGECYNLVTYTTADFAKMKYECKYEVKKELNNLKDKEINAIVYIGANQVLAMLYSLGFVPSKKVKKHYKVLELKQ